MACENKFLAIRVNKKLIDSLIWAILRCWYFFFDERIVYTDQSVFVDALVAGY